MSLGNLQYQQHLQHHFQQQQLQQQQLAQPHYQQQQHQHPLLAAASGNNYAYGKQRPHHHHHHLYHPANPFRPLAGASTNANEYYTGSGHSGYGAEQSGGYDYPQPAQQPAHVPSGGSYSYHAPAGTGYGPPPPPPSLPSIDKKKQTGGSTSTLTALTLLSFFFFVNLLQGCLKEHAEAMNPTVMVMTTGVGVRSRFNKLAEMNSREQSSTSPASTFSSGANILVQTGDVVAASVGPVTPAPAVTLQSPYSGGAVNIGYTHNKPSAPPQYHYNNNNNNNYNNNNQAPVFTGINRDPHPEFYDSMHSAYPNRTLESASHDNRHNYQQQQQQHHHYQPHHHQQQNPEYPSTQQQQSPAADGYPWSYSGGGGAASSSSSSSASSHSSSKPSSYNKPGGSNSPASSSSSSWSSASVPAHIGGSNYFDDDDRYGESYYTRIN